LLRARGSLTLIVLFASLTVGGTAEGAPSQVAPNIGYNASEMETPRSAALGGAARATGSSVEALYLNPAGMATARVYHFYGGAQIWPQARRQSYGAAAVDSVVNKQRIAGGLAANWSSQDPDGVDRDWFDFRFALAAPLSDRFFLGGAMRYVTLRQNGYPDGGLAPSLASQGLPDSDIVADLTFDAGLTIKLADQFSVSAVGTSLTDPGHAFLPMTFGGGAGFTSEDFSLEMDVVGDFTTYADSTLRVMGGGELLMADAFPLRAGYRYDEGANTQAVSGGLGYISREFAIDATVRGLVDGGNSLTFVLGFRYHLESGGLVSGGL
jgi:hypothetical protein